MSSDPTNTNQEHPAPPAAPNQPPHPFAAASSTSNAASVVTAPDEDKYLHPISLVFSLIGQVKSNLLPAFFGVFGAANGNLFYISLALLFLIPSVAVSVIRYFTVRYRITGGELVVNEGLFFRRTRTVPVERIQNIDLVQGVLHRIFKVAQVRVETASGTKPEAVLNVLSLSQVQLLRRSVFEHKKAAPHDVDAASPNHAPPETAASNFKAQPNDAPASTILKIPLSWLAKAGFASNRGLIMVSVLLGLYLQFDRRQGRDFDFSFLSQWLPDLSNPYVMTAAVIAAGILGLVLLRVLGVGWYILRFFGYRLRLSGEDLKISCGLFTKVSATVPRKRIQFISIHSNFVSRLLGLSSIRIETAGGASSENENATTTVSRRWFIPVIPTRDVPEMIGTLRPGLQWQPDQYDWQPLSHQAGRRMVRIAVLVSVLLAPIGYYFFEIWGCSVTLIALPVLVVYALKKSRAVKFARTGFGVVYRSGILTRKISLTFFEKIQATAVAQTPWDRRWAMATLSVDTAAAGPADHAIEIKYLNAEVARAEHHEILLAAARR
jgi:putative membrane protein